MTLEFGSFAASDKVKLPYLLFQPDPPTKKVAIWLHGMGSSIFYSPTWINAVGQALTKRGIAFFAFNNRGAYDAKRLRLDDEFSSEDDGRFQGGTHYEVIADCVKDIDGAVACVRQAGFSELYLAGHSTGANKICVYDHRTRSNPFSKYVLAGPGDDVGLWFAELGAKQFWKALNYAAKAVSEEDPQRIMPKYTGMHPFSVQSAWDILNPDGDYNTFPFYEASTERIGEKSLFAEYRGIAIPTLVIIGAQDEFMTTAGSAAKALDILMSETSNQMLKVNDFMLVDNADHSFYNQETVFANKVAEWLT